MKTLLLAHSIALLPEILLSLTICAVIVADMLAPSPRSKRVCTIFGVTGSVFALLATGVHCASGGSMYYFDHSFVLDSLSASFKLLFLLGTAICLLMGMRSKELTEARQGEFVTLILGAALAACVLASSNNFALFIVAIETLSLCSYVLAGFMKQDRRSAEAGLKYLLYGAVASATMLFGISYLYGLTGTLDIRDAITGVLGASTSGRAALTACLLLFAGLGFKVAMVPFHFWCPDVYEGAPLPATAFLSVVSKAAGLAAFLRLAAAVLSLPEALAVAAPAFTPSVVQIFFGAAAALTMTVGNLGALRQTNLKRLLAWSSIAHAGYLLLGLSVLTETGVQAMLVYLLVYLFMNLGAFWVAMSAANRSGSFDISTMKGFAYAAPMSFAVLFVCLVSLVGIPPTAGFSAKFVLFQQVVSEGMGMLPQTGAFAWTSGGAFFLGLAVLGVINSAISLYYYMKIAKVMVFERGAESAYKALPRYETVVAVLLAVPVLIFLDFGPLMTLFRTPLEGARPIVLSLFK